MEDHLDVQGDEYYIEFMYLSMFINNTVNSSYYVEKQFKMHSTIIFPAVLYGRESWFITLRGETQSENVREWVLRKIFGPRKHKVIGEWRRLHNEELFALYSAPYIIRVIKSRKMRWVKRVARMGDRRISCKFVVG